MNVKREDISLALFQLLYGNPALAGLCKTITRQPKIWTDVKTAEMPWLQLFKGGPATEEESQSQGSGLTKYLIHYNLWLYFYADPSGKTLAETTINNIADAIDAAMYYPRPGERQTLGHLVNNCWIEGGSEWSTTLEDDENIMVAWRITVNTGISASAKAAPR